MTRVHNFNAGPAALPLAVIKQIESDLYDWNGMGASVMEISHRSDEFKALGLETETLLRELLNVPDDYEVLFLGGGGRVHFSAIPLNLLGDKTSIDFINTGFWANLALKEAQKYTTVNLLDTVNQGTLNPSDTWKINPNSAYVYYTSNETIDGWQLRKRPELAHAPLVVDMTSDILSRKIDVAKHGLIFAGCQKNAGIAGLTITIVRKDLITTPHPLTPSVYEYGLQAKAHSLLITAPTFPWYVTNLVLKWVKAQGGVSALQMMNEAKAKLLYEVIDQSDLYQNTIPSQHRSHMSVVFTLSDESLEDEFLKQARERNLYYLKGHRAVGGMRACIYNAISLESVQALADFMKEFALCH